VNVLNAAAVFYCLQGNNSLLPAPFKPKQTTSVTDELRKAFCRILSLQVCRSPILKNTWKVESDPWAGMF
jgi:hypothetical protein